MTDHPVPPDRHRHAHRPARADRRRPALLAAVSALVVVAVATALLLASWDGAEDAATAEQAVATPVASTPPSSLPVTAPAPTTTAEAPAPAPDVPQEFVDAVQRIGIPLDPHTGWVLAEGICVRLGQPEYDQFRMSEGVERLFPSVSDDQAHEFVAMVAESVCGM